MTCEATSSAGQPCRMQALKGSTKCWNHDPTRATARAEASRRGAAATNGRTAALRLETLPAGAPPPLRLAFDLGELRKDNLGAVAIRLARAIANGEVPAREGRLVVEALRVAQNADDAEDLEGDKPPVGARAATVKEMRFIKETGRLPSGLESAMPSEFWVRGPIAWEMRDDEPSPVPAPPPPRPPRRRKKRR